MQMLNFFDLDKIKKIGKDLDGDDCIYFELDFLRINVYSFDGHNTKVQNWGSVQDMDINISIQYNNRYLTSLELMEKIRIDNRFDIFSPIKSEFDDSFARTILRDIENNKFLEIINNAKQLELIHYYKSGEVTGVKCRACKNFENMAERDGLSDGLFTCWSCKTNPFRCQKGVLENDKARWELIYMIKSEE